MGCSDVWLPVPGRCCATLALSHSVALSLELTLTAARSLHVCLFIVPCFIVGVVVAWCVVFTFVIVGLVFPSSARTGADADADVYLCMFMCVCVFICVSYICLIVYR